MYSFEWIIKNLKDGQEAKCVYGKLKDFIIYYSSEYGFDMEEPDGVSYGLIVREQDYVELADTEWIITYSD